MSENKGLNVSVKSFLGAILVILVLMIGTYLLTFVIPAGEYARIVDEAGNTVIVSSGSFRYTQGSLTFGKFLLSLCVYHTIHLCADHPDGNADLL